MASGKKTLLDWRCGQPWLHATYAMGVIMLCVAVILWPEWSTQQRVMGLLCVFLPLHVSEELTWPDGFQFMMNKLIQKSDNPLAYPENRLTDIITNFGAEILFIVMLALTPIADNMFVVFAAFFGVGETVVHTVFSIISLRHYAPMGKRTLYTPGYATPAACCCPWACSACTGW